MTSTIPRAGAAPSARPRRHRALTAVVLVLASVLVGGAGAWAWWNGSITALPLREHCTATALGRSAELDPEQAGNAAVIAAVAVHRRLPSRAATIGIATAMQESKLVNLPGGDRDSIGLFQQRPSQGWGTPAQVRDPVYATNAFYDVLVKVEGYEDLPITKAAQTVQRSAFPSAYADHEPEARILASALTGYSAGGLTCALAPVGSAKGRPADVAAAARRELGADGSAEGATIRFTTSGKGAGTAAWAVAHWAVARAWGLRVQSVETDGRRWDRATTDRGWTTTAGAAPANTVLVRLG